MEPCLKARALKICERASSLIFSVLVMFSILTHHCRTPSQPQPRQYWQERIIHRNLTYLHLESAKGKSSWVEQSRLYLNQLLPLQPWWTSGQGTEVNWLINISYTNFFSRGYKKMRNFFFGFYSSQNETGIAWQKICGKMLSWAPRQHHCGKDFGMHHCQPKEHLFHMFSYLKNSSGISLS